MDFPLQQASFTPGSVQGRIADGFDMRRWLEPHRLTLVMWDTTYALRHAPESMGKETVKGVVSMLSIRACERQNTGYGSSDCAQNPSVEQLGEYFFRRGW